MFLSPSAIPETFVVGVCARVGMPFAASGQLDHEKRMSTFEASVACARGHDLAIRDPLCGRVNADSKSLRNGYRGRVLI